MAYLSKSLRILITGAQGQLARQIVHDAASHLHVTALDRKRLDITDAKAVEDCISHFKPDWIINAAAYTAVDKAQQEAEQCFAVNAQGALHLARAAKQCHARMVHISTDYVFDGQSPRPYKPTDPTQAINIYGASKLQGEQLVREVTDDKVLILRTAWVYGAVGKNFLHTMLRLMHERETIQVVSDQIGTPTSVSTLSRCVWDCIDLGVEGIHHCTDAGVASWYDFAQAIYNLAQHRGLLKNDVVITPINTDQYPTPAQRPMCCILDKTSLWEALSYTTLHWQNALLKELQRLDNFPK